MTMARARLVDPSVLSEMVIDRALGGEIVGKHVPLAARTVEVKNRVEHFSHVDHAGPTGGRHRDQGLDQVPLFVAEVGGIGLSHGCSSLTRVDSGTSLNGNSLHDPLVTGSSLRHSEILIFPVTSGFASTTGITISCLHSMSITTFSAMRGTYGIPAE